MTALFSGSKKLFWLPWLMAVVTLGIFLWPLARPEFREPRPVLAEALPAPAAPLADLEVHQSGPQTVFAGDKITYTVTVLNRGGSTVSGVILTDTWVTNLLQDINTAWPYGVLARFDGYRVNPPGAVATFTQRVNNTFKRGEATWWLNPIVAGDSIEIVFTATVPITIQPTLDNYIAAPLPGSLRRLGPSTVENSVFASVGTEIFPADLATAQVVAPLLLLTQSATGEWAGANECRVGRLLTYTIKIENVLKDTINRPDGWPATRLVITERLPIEVQSAFITATASAPNVMWTYVPASGTLVWRFDPTFVLTRGESTYVTYTVRVPPELSYNPTRRLYTRVSTVDLRAHADLMPFRDPTLKADHSVLVLSPFAKSVKTVSPPVAATSTFPNRPITYTLTYYSPISVTAAMTLEDRMYATFIFSQTAGGDLPTPLVNGPRLLWTNVIVPGYGVITTSFVVTVPANTPITLGGTGCTAARYTNAVTATSTAFPVAAYVGHNNNKLAELTVEPQLKVTKSVAPASQLPGLRVIYTIKLQNVGNTALPAPIVVTDTLPSRFVYKGMESDPPPGEPLVFGNTLVWTDVPTLPGGSTLIFSFKAEVDGAVGEKLKNKVEAYNLQTAYCKIEAADVTILSPFIIDKTAASWTGETVLLGSTSYPLVRQGDSLTYTPSIYNISPRTVYTITAFKDVLDSTSTPAANRTGLINPLTRGLEYSYTLPAPGYPLQPEALWSHVFTATMQGFGTTHAWCNDKERLANAKVEQAIGTVQFTVSGTVAMNTKALAPIYVLPHVSLYQQVYPNPVAIGELVTVVVTLRDNRTDPITPVTGIHLQWNLPTGFTLVDTNPITDSSTATSAFWNNITVPAGGESVIFIHARAPWRKQDGWSSSYTSVAQVNSLDDMSICIPKSTGFVKSQSGTVGPDHTLGLPGPIPSLGDQTYGSLVVNQGIELDKVSKPTEIGPYGVVEYTLNIKNLTGAPVSSIIITDILPFLGTSSWEYLETVAGIEPHSENPLRWNIGAIDAQSQERIVIKTRAASWLGLALNQLVGSAPINVSRATAYTTNVDVMVVSGIGFYKVVEPESIRAGEAVTYTIRLYNGALYDIQPVVITDTLPAGFFFDGMVSPSTLQPTISGQQLVWTLPSKVNKNGGTFNIVFRARTLTEAQGMFTGKYYNDLVAFARRADTQEVVEVPPTGPTAPVYVEGLPTVEMVKTATPRTVTQGGAVVYDIVLHNQSPQSRVLQITDTLPVSFTVAQLISPTQALVSYVGNQQQIAWRDVVIGGQSTLTLTFRARVDANTIPGRYSNVVQLQIGEFVLPPAQPTAHVWVIEIPRTDAQVSKTDGSLVAEKGELINYTIFYTNASAATAFQSIVLTETITPFTYVTLFGTDWTPLGDGRFRREIVGPINPRTSGTVQFMVELAENIPADVQRLHNQVEIAYFTDEPTLEITPYDNRAEDIDLISGGESIVAQKQVAYAGDTLLAGQEVTYTITLFNAGVQAHTLRVTDTLPLSFTLTTPIIPPLALVTQSPSGQQQVIWDGITIPAQSFAAIVFRAISNPRFFGPACNVVQVGREDGVELPPTPPHACVEVQPLQRVDAYVSKDDGVTWVQPGGILNYLIQYGNAATSQTSLATVILTETLSPPEVVGSVLSAGWTAVGNGRYRITLPGLSAGQTGETLFSVRLNNTIPVTVAAVSNQVEVGFTTGEPAVEAYLLNNIGQDVDMIQHNPNDILFSKSVLVPANPAPAGSLVTYTISLVNNTMNTQNLRVTDTLPLHFAFAQAIYPTTGVTTVWQGDHQLVVWETPIAPQMTLPLIFVAQVAPGAPSGRYCNAVQVQRGTTVQPPVSGLACVNVTSQVQTVDAQVSKSNGRTTVTAGDILTYTIRYTNALASDLALQTVVLTEMVSPTEMVAEVLSGGWQPLGDGRYRSLRSALLPGQSATTQFVVRLNSILPPGVTTLLNRVEIGYTTAEPAQEADPSNNIAEDEDTLRPAEGAIQASKTVVAPGDPTLAGSLVTYTISLSNPTQNAYTLRVTDTLPLHFTFAQAVTPPTGVTTVWQGDQQLVVWEMSIAPQGTLTLVFAAQIAADAPTGRYCNAVQVQRGTTVQPQATELACVNVTAPAMAKFVDAQISKSDGRTTAAAGDILTYTIRYTNALASDLPLQTVVLTETIAPPEAVAAMLSAGWQALGDGRYRITLPGLAVGQAAETRFVVRLNATIPVTVPAFYNQVTIGYTTAEPATESNPLDNAAQDVDMTQHNPDDVLFFKTVVAPGDPTLAGSLVTYTISLSNPTQNAYTLRVTDTLPLHFTFAQAVTPPTGVTTVWQGDQQLVVWETSIAPQGTLTLVFAAQIAANTPTDRYCNAVQVQRGTTAQPQATGLACVNVTAPATAKFVDAQISKSDGRTTAAAGDILTYTIRYTNALASDLPLQTVVLTETIAPAAYITLRNTTDWTALGDGRYTRQIAGSLNPGAVVEVRFVVQVSASPPDTLKSITNTVTIGYTTAEPATESNPTDNRYTDINTVTGGVVPTDFTIYLPLVLRNK